MERRPVAVIVGGSSGIGEATARRFARENWRVLSASLKVKETPELPGEGHFAMGLDIRRPEDCLQLYQQVRTRYGHADVLVNSAGVSEANEVVTENFDDWNRPLETMLYGAVHLCRAMIPALHDGARIVNITSIHHNRVIRGSSAYGMAKAAITQWTRSLALELAPRGILVNAVAPGFVRTPMSIKKNGTNELESDWFRRNYVHGDHLPLRRPAEPEEVAGVVWFLAGPDATYMTGSVLTVDGGLSITF